jgi:hypothetical protein
MKTIWKSSCRTQTMTWVFGFNNFFFSFFATSIFPFCVYFPFLSIVGSHSVFSFMLSIFPLTHSFFLSPLRLFSLSLTRSCCLLWALNVYTGPFISFLFSHLITVLLSFLNPLKNSSISTHWYSITFVLTRNFWSFYFMWYS